MQKPAWVGSGRTGPVRHFVNLVVFACEGLICIIDERPGESEGEYVVVLPDELDNRVKQLAKPYRNQTRMDLPSWKRREHDAQQRGFQDCKECIKEAKAMGDPSDVQVQAFWARHRRSSTVRISFSPGCDPAGYPSLPPLPLGKFTGKTASIDGELKFPSNTDSDFAKLHQPPRRKNRPGLILLE